MCSVVYLTHLIILHFVSFWAPYKLEHKIGKRMFVTLHVKVWLAVLISLFDGDFPPFWAKINVIITIGINAIVDSNMYCLHTLYISRTYSYCRCVKS